jgi:hypothetical protein
VLSFSPTNISGILFTVFLCGCQNIVAPGVSCFDLPLARLARLERGNGSIPERKKLCCMRQNYSSNIQSLALLRSEYVEKLNFIPFFLFSFDEVHFEKIGHAEKSAAEMSKSSHKFCFANTGVNGRVQHRVVRGSKFWMITTCTM